MPTSEQARAERAKLIADARDILNTADAESRPLDAEERQKYDAIEADIDSKQAEITRIEKLESLESEVRAIEPRKSPAVQLPAADEDSESDEYRNAFWSYARKGLARMMPEETRALTSSTSSPYGGYTIETQLNDSIVELLDEENVMRQTGATILQVQGNMDIPVESSLGSASWVAEGSSISDSDVVFGKTSLSPNQLTTMIKVSELLLYNNVLGPDQMSQYIASAFARRLATAEETAFVNGSGSGEPTGIVGGSGAGVTAAGAAAITADEVIDLYHSLGRSYRTRSAGWMMADATAKIIRKLKDGDNQYLWQPGLQAGTPDRLLGLPVYISAGMPAATTGNKSVLIADFSYYYISEHGPRLFQRLDERYADEGYVAFKMTHFLDGALVNSAAAKHLVQA